MQVLITLNKATCHMLMIPSNPVKVENFSKIKAVWYWLVYLLVLGVKKGVMLYRFPVMLYRSPLYYRIVSAHVIVHMHLHIYLHQST